VKRSPNTRVVVEVAAACILGLAAYTSLHDSSFQPRQFDSSADLTPSNMVFKVQRPDGTFTNVAAPHYWPIGDYWLPGEFEALLEKRKQERQQQPQ
jgi:hypothetical protein